MSNFMFGAEFDMSEHFKVLTCDATTVYSAGSLGSYYAFLGGIAGDFAGSPLRTAFEKSGIPLDEVVGMVPLCSVQKGSTQVRGNGGCICAYNNEFGDPDTWTDSAKTATYALNAPASATYMCRFLLILR